MDEQKTLHFRVNAGPRLSPSRGWRWHSSRAVWGWSAGTSSSRCRYPRPWENPPRCRLPTARDSPASCSPSLYRPLWQSVALSVLSSYTPHKVRWRTWSLCGDSRTPCLTELVFFLLNRIWWISNIQVLFWDFFFSPRKFAIKIYSLSLSSSSL